MPEDGRSRLDDRIREWCVDVERIEDRAGALLGFGFRRTQPVVVKIHNRPDEWRAGEVLRAFDGIRTARVIEHSPGAILLERLAPATPLSDLCQRGEDEHATAILADVMRSMSPVGIPAGTPTVEGWCGSLDRFAVGGCETIPAILVERARTVYVDLCRSQRDVRLLHGDLHHDNVLLDATRGWVAVDPKGVVGEVAFEVGAALRNPLDLPALFTTPATIDSRVERFSSNLGLDRTRVTRWAFVQSVLAAIWLFEDGEPVTPGHPWLNLATTVYQCL